MPGPGDAKAAGTQPSSCGVSRREKLLRVRAEEPTWGEQGAEMGRGCLSKVGSRRTERSSWPKQGVTKSRFREVIRS